MKQSNVGLVELPLRVETADAVTWHEVADVVVVGFGGAGACAAIEARERGASVIAVDRFDGGGSTAYSGGVVYAGGTRVQAEAGFPDTAKAMFDYLSMEVGDAVTPETLKRFCDGSAEDVEWLTRQGVVYNRNAMTGKTAYPPDDKSLYYSGNEKTPRFKAAAAPAPRGHRAVGKGFTGYAYFAALRAAALQADVRLIAHAPVRRLVMDAEQRVVGIEVDVLPEAAQARHRELYGKAGPKPFAAKAAEASIEECVQFEQSCGAERRLIRARGGVILAAGGFIYNLDMLERYSPFLAENHSAIIRLGCMGDDGSGIRLGESANGATGWLENVFVNKLVSPPEGLLKGMAVNQKGMRFMNEDTYCGFLGAAIAKQPGSRSWLIMDRVAFWQVIRQCLFGDRSLFALFFGPALLNILLGGTKIAWSVKSLARKCGADPLTLQASLDAYNKGAETGVDEFEKLKENMGPIKTQPFFALNISLGNKFGFAQMFTLGGLRVDEDSGLVIAEHGGTIKGLYAAGRNAVGLCSYGYLSGMSLADGVFSGRRAGAHAATAIKSFNRTLETAARQP